MTAQEIRAFRRRAQISQVQMARFFRVTQATISSWETGKTVPSPIHVALLEEMREKYEAEAKERNRRHGLGALIASGLLVVAYVLDKYDEPRPTD